MGQYSCDDYSPMSLGIIKSLIILSNPLGLLVGEPGVDSLLILSILPAWGYVVLHTGFISLIGTLMFLVF